MRTLVLINFVFLLCAFPFGCARPPDVVLYTSVDQVFAEEVIKEVETQTGMRVALLTDTEATKTVGLVQRLIAERPRPQADVFWSSEILNTIALKQRGILEEYRSPSASSIPMRFKDPDGTWVGFAVRARVVVYNTDKVKREDAPKSLEELTSSRWRGKVAVASPLFGTSLTHAAILFESWGNERAKKYFAALRGSDALVVDGNSMVRDLVARGEALVGLTDTDDVYVGIAKGWPIDIVLMDQDGLGACIIPNTVAVIRGGPNPKNAKRLVDFLLSEHVERMLAKSDSHNSPVRSTIDVPKGVLRLTDIHLMSVDYDRAAERIPETTAFLQDIFLK